MTITFYQATGGPVPKIEIYLRNAGAPPSGDRDIWIMGERVAAGTSVAEEVRSTPFGSEAEAIAWFGAGSQGAYLASYAFAFNNPEIGRPKGGIYGVALTEPAAGAYATAILTLATNASAVGTWIFSAGGHIFSVPVATGNTPTEQGDLVVAAWNALAPADKLPMTPVNVAGTITWTANSKGAGLNGTVFSTIQDPGVATTDTWTASGVVANGTTYPTLTTVITNMASTRTKVLVYPHADDATGVEALIDHINAKSAAPSMLGSQLVLASRKSTVALLISGGGTGADDYDDADGERVCMGGSRGLHTWTGEAAINLACAYAAEPNLGRSHDGIDLDLYPVTRANAFTEAEQKTLLNGGVSPINVPTGETAMKITRLVAIRTAYGVMDFALMSVLDYVRDVLAARIAADYPRASFVEDDQLATTAEHVRTPQMFRESCRLAFKTCEELGLIYGVDADFKDVDVELDMTTGTVSVALPTRMVTQGHNYMVRLDAEV